MHYELVYREHTLVVRIHPKAWSEFPQVNWMETPIVKQYEKTYGFSFVSPDVGKWGFEKSLETSISAEDGWYEVCAKLPKIRNNDHNSQVPLRVSLNLLFLILSIGLGEKKDTAHHLPQLIVVNGLRVEVGHHGGSLSAEVSDEVAQWIDQQPHEAHNTVIVQAMKDAYHYMWPEDRKWSRFGALCRKTGLIYLDVPGQACGLGPDKYSGGEIVGGYELVPHNVDSGLEQLSLIAGLAKLHELVKKDLK
jgi:hypothetical protein